MFNTCNSATSSDKNYALCRKELDLITNGNFISEGYETLKDIQFLKIKGLTNFWEHEDNISIIPLVGDILSGNARYGIPFVYAIIGNNKGINIYVGTSKIFSDGLKSSYESIYPGIDLEIQDKSPLKDVDCKYGGMFTGIPTNKIDAEKRSFQIDNLCRGMLGKDFVYLIAASGISNVAVTLGHERILEEMENVYSFINQTVSGGSQGNQQIQKQDFQSKNYFDNLETMEAYIKEGTSRGMWRFNGYYASNNILDGKKLGNIVKSVFSGEESKPDPVRIIEYNLIKDAISNVYMISDRSENVHNHPLGEWYSNRINKTVSLYEYKYQTLLNSDQLSIFCQLPVKEFPGYYIDDYVEFDTSNRTKDQLTKPVPIGDICVAGRNSNSYVSNKYYLEKNDFTRHALIIGITGGGKTNTSKSVLSTLWNADNDADKIPFLVIESAKREYWELRNLKGFEDLLVFTLGSEASATSVKYRINPFETNPDISLQTHIDYLMSTFKAAFELYPPMPYVLEQAVYEVYSDKGWDIVENKNIYGFTEYPTLSDLYNKIDVVVDDLGYHQEVQSNVKAALQSRIYSLMIGGKGAMMNTPKSVPISKLLSRPVVLELEDLGDDETKSFVIGILLVQLYEYRKSQMKKGHKELNHILMVEEAHRLLKNVPEGGEGGNTRAKSVEFFCNMLAEIRTYGQGIIIADQIPTKIAPDSIKNTNLKIVHRTVAFEDRETMGKAMNMTEEQIEYLSSLRRGYAAVYAEGDNKPKCVKFPLVRSVYDNDREEVLKEIRTKVQDIAKDYDVVIKKHIGCSFCEHRCKYYEINSSYIDEKLNLNKVCSLLKNAGYSPVSLSGLLDSKLLKDLNLTNIFEQICVLGIVLQKCTDLNDGKRQRILAKYLKYCHQ